MFTLHRGSLIAHFEIMALCAAALRSRKEEHQCSPVLKDACGWLWTVREHFKVGEHFSFLELLQWW